MKNKHLFWGFLFLTLGLLILINNFTSVGFYWLNIWEFWPLFLILFGIALLIKQEKIKSIVLSLTAIILGAAIFSTFRTGWEHFHNEVIVDFKNGVQIKDIDDKNLETMLFEENYNDNIKYAVLEFEGNAGVFKINDTTASLFSAVTKGYENQYNLIRSADDSDSVKINFKDEGDDILIFKGKKNNRINISLNSNPVWKLNFDVGGAATEFDLRKYKVEELDIDIGAASLKLYLGNLIDTCNVNIDAGAASIEILIPENTGCEVYADIVLSSRKLDDFKKVKDDIYRTENFESSAKKIFMNIDTGVSSVRIRRYAVNNL